MSGQQEAPYEIAPIIDELVAEIGSLRLALAKSNAQTAKAYQLLQTAESRIIEPAPEDPQPTPGAELQALRPE